MPSYWLSCKKFTVQVEVDDNGIITEGAPIVKKFVGQPIVNLTRWMNDLGGFRFNKLKSIETE